LALYDHETTGVELEPPPISEPVGNDALVVIHAREKDTQGKRYVLRNGPVRVGRMPDNEIVLDDVGVSRRHARFEKRSAGWVVMDVGSRNGTLWNDGEMSGEVTLKNGDRVKIGSTIFKFLSGDDAESQFFEEICKFRTIDHLTQVHSRKYFEDELEREFWRARRHGRPLSLIVFDVDSFKDVNDEHGHLVGDAVLREVAQLALGRVRRHDVVARYGGDEFVVLMPETTLENALHLANELCPSIAAHPIAFQSARLSASTSMGVAKLHDGDTAPRDLFRRADTALLTAKRAGRNCVRGEGSPYSVTL
jgi:diguanylate cyclase (GGDEF)-like protein